MLTPVFRNYVRFDCLLERFAMQKVAFEPQPLRRSFIDQLLTEVLELELEPVLRDEVVKERYEKVK